MTCSCGRITCNCGIPCFCTESSCDCADCSFAVGKFCKICDRPFDVEYNPMYEVGDTTCTCFLGESHLNQDFLDWFHNTMFASVNMWAMTRYNTPYPIAYPTVVVQAFQLNSLPHEVALRHRKPYLTYCEQAARTALSLIPELQRYAGEFVLCDYESSSDSSVWIFSPRPTRNLTYLSELTLSEITSPESLQFTSPSTESSYPLTESFECSWKSDYGQIHETANSKQPSRHPLPEVQKTPLSETVLLKSDSLTKTSNAPVTTVSYPSDFVSKVRSTLDNEQETFVAVCDVLPQTSSTFICGQKAPVPNAETSAEFQHQPLYKFNQGLGATMSTPISDLEYSYWKKKVEKSKSFQLADNISTNSSHWKRYVAEWIDTLPTEYNRSSSKK